MMYKEFEEIAGYEVSYETYNNIIEPMYMATNLSKQEFVKMLDKKAFALPTKAEMKKEMRKIANHLFDICGHYTDWKSEEELDKLAKEYAKRFYGIAWSERFESFVYFNRGYEFPEIERGCTYPKEVVIGVGRYEYERIVLVK